MEGGEFLRWAGGRCVKIYRIHSPMDGQTRPQGGGGGN